MLLPDAFTLIGLALAFLLRVFEPGLSDRGGVAIGTAVDAAIAGGILLLVWAIYWLLRRRQGVGMGDIKLMAMMGAFLGLPLTLFAYFVGIVAATVFVVILIARRKARRFDRIPLGTFLCAAGILAIFAGAPFVTWYLGLMH